jgi:CheY-like chemotaxis protein
MRALVVDDNATNRLILEEVLGSWRINTASVQGGAAALEALRAGVVDSFDVVCLDQHMPDMDGFEVAQAIRLQPHLRILMLISAGHLASDTSPADLGIEAYLIKPVSQSELFAALARALGSPVERSAQRAGTAPSETRSLRILLAEDFVGNQRLATAVLQQRGHEVVLAEDGSQAVAAFNDADFDVVLMDVQMPVMDGFEATTQIREAEAGTGHHTPIIALTARAMRGDAELCLQAGMDDYISKPFRPRDLLDAITRNVPAAQADTVQPGADVAAAALDGEQILDFVDGDVVLLAELVDFMRTTCPGLLEEVEQLLPSGDASEIRKKAHALKNAVGVIGENPAHQSALELELAADRGDVEELRELTARCGSRSRDLIAALTEYIEELNSAAAGTSGKLD